MLVDTAFVADLVLHARAGYPLLAIDTTEEVRALLCVAEAGRQAVRRDATLQDAFDAIGDSDFRREATAVATAAGDGPTAKAALSQWLATKTGPDVDAARDALGLPLVTYDTVGGFCGPAGPLSKLFVDDPYGAVLALGSLDGGLPTHCVVAFLDLHQYLADPHNPRLRRALRRLVESDSLVTAALRRTVVLVQPAWDRPAELKHLIANVPLRLPPRAALVGVFDAATGGVVVDPATREAAVDALQGFTETEAVNATYLARVKRGGIPAEAVGDLHEQKARSFAGDQVLTYASAAAVAAVSPLGGFDAYLDYLAECRACMTERAAALKVRRPKGVLIIGPPGSGKSAAAVLTAKRLALPLLTYDVSAVFGSLVGESEARQRAALARVSATGPCVLLIDEVDKALGGMGGAGGDGGTSQRVFGKLLTWLAAENESAFVVMTANRLTDAAGHQTVPVETLRAGRIDAVFATSFPTRVERAAIFEIHVERAGGQWGLFSDAQKERLAAGTEDYVGAEIEQAVAVAVRRAFTATGEVQPTDDQLLKAVNQVTPVKRLDPAGVAAMEQYARDRGALPVGRPPAADHSPGRRRRAV
jgi:ABC-type iron transport system FetAB ATPase subunit